MKKLLSSYKRYQSKAEKYKDKRSMRSKYVKYSNKAANIKFNLYSSWIEEIEKQNSDFKKLADRNRELLTDIEFNAIRKEIGVSLFGVHTSQLSGRIRPNGILSAKAKTMGGFFIPVMSYCNKYSGTIDCLGHISLEGAQTGLGIKTLPKTFKASTSRNGKIKFTADQREYEILNQGREFVKEIIARPFQSPATQKEFLGNREKMYAVLERKLTQGILN